MGAYGEGAQGGPLPYLYDTQPPVIAEVQITDGTYAADDNLEIILVWNEVAIVVGEGTPQLHIDIGTNAAAKEAEYVEGSGSNHWPFRYTVVATDTDDADGIELGNSGNLDLNGADVADIVGNTNPTGTPYTLPVTSFPAVLIDNSP